MQYLSETLFGKVTKAGTITIPKKLRMKYHIKVGDVVKYADLDDGIKIVPSELTRTFSAGERFESGEGERICNSLCYRIFHFFGSSLIIRKLNQP